jgi:hypothetical protein
MYLGRGIAEHRMACATNEIMAELTAPITTTVAFDRARSKRCANRRMMRFQNGSALSPHAPASSTMTGTS